MCTQRTYLQLIAGLAATFLLMGCASPESVSPTITQKTGTVPTISSTATQTIEAQLASEIDAFMAGLVTISTGSGTGAASKAFVPRLTATLIPAARSSSLAIGKT